jgi:hypothetical protein
MSITLGNYFVETKKTVGDLPVGSDNIIAETPCEDSINLATVQPQYKKIHEYTGSQAASPAMIGFAIPPTFKLLPDDVFADGFDYEVAITYSYSGTAPSIENNFFTYTQGGNNWFHPLTGSDTVVMNENNCGGSYANTVRSLLLDASGLGAFTLNYTIEIRQLIPATIEIELCGGGISTNQTTLKVVSDVIEVYINGEGEPIEVNADKRKDVYDPADLGFGELAKMPQTCLGYSVYYISYIYSSPFVGVDKTYWLASGVYEAKINIPKVPPQVLDFKLWDGSNYVLNKASDPDGLMDWWPLTLVSTDLNSTLEIWDGAIQETSSGEQYVNFKYDFSEYDCPCDECGTDCGEINVIFHQNCGAQYSLKFNLMIQEGKYNVEGDTFTQGNELITPITKIHANYDFVISEYSDETYLLLMELIADNILIEVVDNIDTGNPTTLYYINKESFSPSWNFNSKLGSLTLPVIKKNSIRTSRRNCCN